MQTTEELKETMQQAQEVLTVRRVFGEPFEHDGVTVIPAARVQGAAGGGSGQGPEGTGEGSGTGLALNAKPFGVYVFKGDDVAWRPAVDVNKVILGAQLVAIVALLLIRTIVKTRAKQAAVSALVER